MLIKSNSTKFNVTRVVLRFLIVVLAVCFSLNFVPDRIINSAYHFVFFKIHPDENISRSKYFGLASNFSLHYTWENFFNMIKYQFMDLPTIHLHMSLPVYLKVKNAVVKIQARGTPLTDEDKSFEVPATIVNGNKKIKVKLKLKGIYLDHYEGKKWSFKIQTKNDDLLFGMKRFSLQNPKVRNNVYEWIYQAANKNEGLLNLQYKFTRLTLNGEDLGIYAIEEFFDKHLVERGKKREGLFVKLQGNYLQALQQKKIMSDEHLLTVFKNLNLRYLDYSKDPTSAKYLFDFDLTAKYFALADLFSGSHGHLPDNFVAYLNPITNLLEPIPFDGNVGGYLHAQSEKLFIEDGFNYSISHSASFYNLFKNHDFMLLYLQYLKKYSTHGYWDKFFNDIKNEHHHYGQMIYLNENISRFNDIVSGNSMYINNFFNSFKTTDLSIVADKIIANFPKSDLNDFKLLEADMKSNLKKIYDISIDENYQKQKYNLTNYANYFIEGANKTDLFLKNKKTKIEKTIIIPTGKKVVLKPGNEIFFIKNANMISYSPLEFIGTSLQPIIVTNGLNNPGGGIIVINAEKTSTLKHVQFSKLAAPNFNGWRQTGAINFYQSNVDIDHCEFNQNLSGDDFLNIIRSTFSLNNSKFIGTNADALDVDFSNGKVVNSEFIEPNNDAMDFSGSSVVVSRTKVVSAGDKGLSAGEKSHIEISDSSFINSNIGIATKDGSVVKTRKIEIKECQLGITTFRKKREYSYPSLIGDEVILTNNKTNFLIGRKSLVTINGENKEKTAINNSKIKELLYDSNI